MFQVLRFGKQKKRFAVLFPYFSICAYVDGIAVIYITVPRLFSLLAAIYIGIM